ncbi:MAG: phosphotransferase [bacterium]|nr:phosphotransferase [bacterium]
MRKFKIEGTNATLLKSIDKKIIRKKKIKGLCAYPRIVPQNKILKLLKGSNLKYPKLIRNRLLTVDIEYIEGKPIADIDKNYLTGIVCNYIYEMSKIDCTSIKKYSKWTNNSEFLYYQINNLLLLVRKSGYIDKLKRVGIDFNSLLAIKNIKLDDNRRQMLIHGDINKNNIIQDNSQFTLIDWELSCYADIAYDLALFFINESYNESEMNVVIDRLCGSLLLDPNTIMRDVSIYMKFEYYRKSIVGFIEAINLKNKKQSNDNLLQQTYEYYSKITRPLILDNIRNIINN